MGTKKENAKNKKSAILPKNSQEQEQLLSMMQTPDNEVIKKATKILKQFQDILQCQSAQMDQITRNTNPSIRHLSCVQLRKVLRKHWNKTSSNMKEIIRNSLLEHQIHEKQRNVCIGIVSLISIIAKIDIPKNEFNQLYTWTEKAIQSNDILLQESSLSILRNQIEMIPKSIQPQHITTFRTIFETFASSNDKILRKRAQNGLHSIFTRQITDDERTSMERCILPLVDIMIQTIQEHDEDSLAVLQNIFSSLIDDDVQYKYLPKLYEAICSIITNTVQDISVRDKAAFFITEIIQTKPGYIVKCNLVTVTLNVGYQLLCEEDDEVFESSELTAQRVGACIFESCMEYLPKQDFFTICTQCIQQFIQSSNPYNRKGSLILLALLAEGCSNYLIELDNGKALTVIVQSIINMLLYDTHVQVRTAAAVCIFQLAEYISDEISQMHELIIPSQLQSINRKDENPIVHEKACFALDACCEYLGDIIVLYTPHLMTYLQNQLNTNDPKIITAAISAIKSISSSSKLGFLPYFDTTLNYLSQFLDCNDPKFMLIRSYATECIGSIAQAVGVENWGDKISPQIVQILRGMELSNFQLREASFIFQSRIIETLGNNVTNELVHSTIEQALLTLESEEGLEIDDDDDEEVGGATQEGFSDDDDDDDNTIDDTKKNQNKDIDGGDNDDDYDEDDEHVNVSFRVGAIEEKLAAQEAISSTFLHCEKFALPLLQKTMDSLQEISVYLYGPLRETVQNTYNSIIIALNKVYPNKNTNINSIHVPQNPEIEEILRNLFILFTESIVSDEYVPAVAKAISNVETSLRLFGKDILPKDDNEQKEFYTSQVVLAEERGLCQINAENNDIKSESGLEVLESLCDLVNTMTQIMGPESLTIYTRLFPCLTKFCDHQRPEIFRSMVIGTIAESIENLDEYGKPFAQHLLNMSTIQLQDQSIDVRRNTVYQVGVLTLILKKDIASYQNNFIELTKPMLDIPQDNSLKTKALYIGAKENIIAAYIKMVFTNPEIIPPEQYLPIIFSSLPFTEDLLEATKVCPILIQLAVKYPNIIQQYIIPMAQMFSTVLQQQTANITDDVRNSMLQFLHSTCTQNPDPSLQKLIEGIPL